eukprot:Ihof_evm2s465 gene=Ihof_evmTU2s465
MSGDFSNPVAPAGFSKPVAPTKSEKLNNEDFRKLLQTPRAGGATKGMSLGGGFRGSLTPATGGNAVVKKKHNPNSAYYKEKAKEKAEFESKYKDRAKDRRNNEDEDEEEISLPINIMPSIHEGDSQAAYLAKIEQTKFLGGDFEHTHLVKGLDYALLQKVKADINAQENPETEDEKDKPMPKPEERFRTALGRRIYDAAFMKKPLVKVDMFAPGRMAYAFHLTDDLEDGSEIPTTVRRSKAEVADLKHELTQAATNDIVIDKLALIFSALRQGIRDRKERRRRDRELHKAGHSEGPRKPIDDEDIYDNVGTYELPTKEELRDRRTDRDPGPARPPTSYFTVGQGYGDMDAEEEGPGVGPRPPSQVNNGDDDVIGPYPGGDEDVTGPYPSADTLPNNTAQADVAAWETTNKGNTNKRLQELAGEDSYAECYPSAYDYADAVYDDSDGEPDYNKMDQGMGKKAGPSRFDYDDEEDWARDKSNQEAMPKAAFQFGVKMAEGRGTRRNKVGGKGDLKEKDKETKEKMKIDQQLNKIQQIWKRKPSDTGNS